MTVWPGVCDEVTTVTVRDGTGIVVERFEPAAPATSIVLFLHGIGSYAGPYRRFARRLADGGVCVHLPDLRGHGRSGTRGRIGPPEAVMADVEALLEHVRGAHPGAEIVLAGESMGGLLALSYAASARSGPDRLLLLAPALRLHWAKWVHGGLAHLAELPHAIRTRTGFSMHAPVPGEPTRDPEFRRRVQTDPLMLQQAPVAYFATIARLIVASSTRYGARVGIPCLIVQGDADLVLDGAAARRLAERMGSAELRTVAGGWHNLLWDPTWEATAASVAEWLTGPTGPRDRPTS